MQRREIKSAGANFRRKIDFRGVANDRPPIQAHKAAFEVFPEPCRLIELPRQIKITTAVRMPPIKPSPRRRDVGFFIWSAEDET
jgi:hypothetical protein